MKVDTYVTPDKFQHWQKVGEQMGFYVASGPFIRSSYKVGEFYIKHLLHQKGVGVTVDDEMKRVDQVILVKSVYK
jgi:lipoyl synthase